MAHRAATSSDLSRLGSRYAWLPVFVGVLLLAPTGSMDFARGEDALAGEKLLEKVFAAWRDQERGIDSAKIVLRGEQAAASDLTPAPAPSDHHERLANGHAIESPDFRVSVSFAGQEGWSKIETNRPRFHLTKRQYIPYQFAAAYDGRPDGARVLEAPQGAVTGEGVIFPEEERNIEVGYASLIPLFMSMRPFATAFVRRELGDFAISSKSTEDQLCLATPSQDQELWVGRHAPYPLQKVMLLRDGESPFAIIEISAHQREGAWTLPQAWRCTYFDNSEGRPTSWETYRAVEYQLNTRLEQSDFHLAFAPGTLVTRNDLPQGPGQGQQFDYVSADDQWVRVPSDAVPFILEHGASALAGGQQPAATNGWLLVINVGVILLLVMGILLARLRSSGQLIR